MNTLKAGLSAGLIVFVLFGATSLTGCDFIRRSDVKRVDKGEFTKPTRLPLVMDEAAVAQQGEKVTVCSVSVAIDQIERKVGEGAGGQDLVKMRVSVTNETTEKEFAIIPFDFYLNDEDGKPIGLSYSAVIDEPMEAGPLRPGQTVSGGVAYDVSADKKDLSFFWMPGWCSDKVLIKFTY
jgi:hypothetical protein